MFSFFHFFSTPIIINSKVTLKNILITHPNKKGLLFYVNESFEINKIY